MTGQGGAATVADDLAREYRRARVPSWLGQGYFSREETGERRPAWRAARDRRVGARHRRRAIQRRCRPGPGTASPRAVIGSPACTAGSGCGCLV